jgi:hypothetical protein
MCKHGEGAWLRRGETSSVQILLGKAIQYIGNALAMTRTKPAGNRADQPAHIILQSLNHR